MLWAIQSSQAPDVFFTSFIFFMGSAFGSFINVLTMRYGKKLPTGRSFCPRCRRTLTISDLIPIFSFIFLRGCCRACKKQISVQYPIVELTIGLLALIIFLPLPATPLLLAGALLKFIIAALLVTLFLIDLRTMLLPDIYIVLLSIAVVLHQFLDPSYGFLITSHQLLITGSIGALLGAGFLALLWLITGGRGLGLGDVKLMLPLGFLFGPSGTVFLLFLAFITGGLFASLLLLMRRVTLKTAVPFGPFLCATAILLLINPDLPNRFLSLLLL